MSVEYSVYGRSMKVNSIQNYNPNYYAQRGVDNNNASFSSNKNNSPAFKGTLAVNFWDAIARGGFAASFTVQDMTGTNFPRTYQALQRNKDITGQNNYKAAAEVAIREFLTGPSMCAIPMFVLAIAKKTSGTANEVPMENIAPFADQMKTILQKTPISHTDLDFPKNFPAEFSQRMKTSFYERMFALSLGEDLSGGKKVSSTAKELASMLNEYDIAPKRGLFKQLLNKDLTEKAENGLEAVKGWKIEAKDQIFDKIVTRFSDAKKHLTDDYTTLLTTDMNGTLEKPNSISSLIKDFSNFGNDVQKTMQKHVTKNGAITSVGLDFDSFMEAFKTKRTGSKFITNVLMVAATALFMMNIPKMYTLYKTNPETDAFRSEEGEVIRANK